MTSKLARQLENLDSLLATIQQYPCFDEEDTQWVTADRAAVLAELQQETQREDARRRDEEAKTNDQLRLEQRMNVLADVDNATGVLKERSGLRRKFVAKQRQLSEQVRNGK